MVYCLWFILDDPKLSTLARGIIEEEKNDILISPASYWEIAIKIRLKKYSLPQPYLQFMQSQIASNEFKYGSLLFYVLAEEHLTKAIET